MSIVLVRHGETALNASRVIQPADTPLSERGLAQAAALARRLARERGFADRTPPGRSSAAILSSDLPRALQTATAIASETGLEVRTTELLQERNFGAWRGRAYDTLGFDPLATDDAPPGGESVVEFRARVALAFEAILAAHRALDGDLFVVSHGLVIRTLLERHLRLPVGAGLPASLSNTSITVCAPNSPYEVGLLNCVRHLDADDLRDGGRGLSGF